MPHALETLPAVIRRVRKMVADQCRWRDELQPVTAFASWA
jgi:hypothetical protein